MFLTKIWNFLGGNAGQIQTVAALIGLGLGIYALIYSKAQIRLAQSERLFSIKNQLISESFSILQDIESMLNNIKLIQQVDLKNSRASQNSAVKDKAEALFLKLDSLSSHLNSTKEHLLDFQDSFNSTKAVVTIDRVERLFDDLMI